MDIIPNILPIVVGFIIGVVTVAMAIELRWRKETPQETCKLTEEWSLFELKNPLIMAEKIWVETPGNAKILVASKSVHKGEVKKHSGVRSNFALGENRALIFTGEIKKGVLALWTIDETIMRKLRKEFDQLWGDAGTNVGTSHPTASTHPGAAPGGTTIIPLREDTELVTVRGRVRATVPFRDGFLLRLSTEDRVVGIIIKKQVDLTGKLVEVTGTTIKGDYPLIEATQITEIGTGTTLG